MDNYVSMEIYIEKGITIMEFNTEIFFERFTSNKYLLSAIKTKGSCLLYHYKTAKRWTEIINETFKLMNNDLVGNDLEFSYEYFKIDGSIWGVSEKENERVEKLIRELGINRKHQFVWDFIAAIEHENDHKDWLYEMKQLLQFKAPYKILIGYSNKAFENQDSFRDSLEEILSIFSKNQYIHEGEQFLFIFAKRYNEVKNDEELTYKGFLFDVNNNSYKFRKTLKGETIYF